MNIKLLRRAQRSILDPNNRFDMNDWCCCIAGHILQAAGEPVSLEQIVKNAAIIPHGAVIAADAGEFAEPLRDLFVAYASWDTTNRNQAVAGLDRLIAMAQCSPALEPTQAAPLCSPALEPAAQARRARAGEQEEEQAAEEELELVGV